MPWPSSRTSVWWDSPRSWRIPLGSTSTSTPRCRRPAWPTRARISLRPYPTPSRAPTPTPSLGPLTVPRWRRAPKRLAAFAAGAVGVLAVLVALVQRDTPAPLPEVSPVTTAPETVVVRVPAPADSQPTTSTQPEAIGRRADPAPPRPAAAGAPPAGAPGGPFLRHPPRPGGLSAGGR